MKSFLKGLVASLLSIILPGSGQIYNGQRHKTLLGYSLFFSIPIVFIVLKWTYFFWGFVILCLFLIRNALTGF